MSRICFSCKKRKEFSEFNRDKSRPEGYSYECRECTRERGKAHYNANKERYREYRVKNESRIKTRLRKKMYGVSQEEFEKVLLQQNNCCAICNKIFGDKFYTGPVVDHCHTTKRFRGLLCHECNFLLGKSKDSVDILKRAILYLEKREDNDNIGL